MEDNEFLSERIKALEKSIRFFSNDSRVARELWVAGSFLKNIGVAFVDNELIAVDNDPPDVLYKEARFEIKEILDPGRKRHDEYRAELAKAHSARAPSELVELFTPTDSSIAEVFYLCLNRMEKLHKYPIGIRACTDLLFYVNLHRVMDFVEEPFPDSKEMAKGGWRSVSFIKGRMSCCLFANQSAPAFLRSAVGSIYHRNKAIKRRGT
jgi:hypothetical protein